MFFPMFMYVCGHGYIYVCGYISVYMFICEYIYMFVHTQGSDYFTEVITSYSFQLFAILSQYFLVEHPSSASYALIHYSEWLCNIRSTPFVCHSKQYWIKHAHTDVMTRWWFTEKTDPKEWDYQIKGCNILKFNKARTNRFFKRRLFAFLPATC